MSTPRILRHPGGGQPFCLICNRPVSLETAKTNEDGYAVHEECYLDKICGKIPPRTKKPPATQS